jgi:hypothetical protein
MNRPRRLGTIVATLGGILLVVGIGVTAFVAGRAARTIDSATESVGEAIENVTGEGEFTRAGEVTVQSILALSELTTVEMVEYTVVEKGDDRGLLNWATGDRIEMFAVARIGAGVDLSTLEEDDIFADPESRRAIIRLPSSTVTYVAVDNDATHVYDRETGLFTKGDPDLERAARITAEDVLVGKAHEAGIIDLANDRAEQILEDLLTSFGYTDIDVVVEAPPPAGE